MPGEVVIGIREEDLFDAGDYGMRIAICVAQSIVEMDQMDVGK